MSERTFYYWKPRFEAGGYEALLTFASHAPKHPNRIDEGRLDLTPIPKVLSNQDKEGIQQQVIQLRQQHPNWGKRRLADELSKANDWTALVSPNTVRRILVDAGLWPVRKTPAKKSVLLV